MSPGRAFRDALTQATPLQLVGVSNALCAKMAQATGFRAIYLSGSGVASGQFAWPDLGVLTRTEMITEVRRITQACPLPLIVDADTADGQPLGIRRWIEALLAAGAAGCHIEDQVRDKRCGHRDNKRLCSQQEMVQRVKVARESAANTDFYLIARTDAYASEGLTQTLLRAKAYLEAGADAIFLEALPGINALANAKNELAATVLANMTEFGKTQVFDARTAAKANIDILLYPLTVFRVMNQAAMMAFDAIKHDKQATLLAQCQTRDELYQLIDYTSQEAALDAYYQSLENER